MLQAALITGSLITLLSSQKIFLPPALPVLNHHLLLCITLPPAILFLLLVQSIITITHFLLTTLD